MLNKVLVTGASGFLGRQILQAFKEAGWDAVGTALSRSNPPALRKVDLLDESAVVNVLESERPHLVVHSAANRFPDKCDADPDGARAVNVTATRFLAKAAAERQIFMLYISTDYVFSGRDGEAPYEADAAPGPTNLYGTTKLEGERAIAEEAGDLAVALRVPVLYGPTEDRSESAVNVLLDAVLKAQETEAHVNMDHWAIRCPTNTEDVGRVCKDIAGKYLATASTSLPRILQFSSKDRFTKYEMCQMMAEILGLGLQGMTANKQGNDPGSKTQRPYNTQLSTRNLEELGIPIWTQDFRAWWRREFNAFRH